MRVYYLPGTMPGAVGTFLRHLTGVGKIDIKQLCEELYDNACHEPCKGQGS